MHFLGHCCKPPAIPSSCSCKGLSEANRSTPCRLFIPLELTKSFLVTLSGSITFAIRSFVSCINWLLLFRYTQNHLHAFKVASKCGFEIFNGGGGRITNSAKHINEYIEGTIERLGFTPDLYYLHRIDPSMLKNTATSPLSV